MPFLGYMILFNETILGYLALSDTYIWKEDDGAGYRLFLFYFGLSSAGIGSLFYQWFCPRGVKINAEMDDYFQREHVLLSEQWIKFLSDITKEEFHRRIEKKYLISDEHRQVISNMQTLGDNLSSAERENPKYKDFEKEVIKAHWFMQITRYPTARAFSIIFYSLGLLLLAIPTIDTFIRVCIAFGNRLFA